jgi:HEAT repeat protein
VYIRNNAVFALGQIGAQPAMVVPALTRCLEDPFDNTRANAANALAVFKKDARSAVPALLKLLAREQTNSTVISGTPGNFNTVWGTPPPAPGRAAARALFGSANIDVLGPTTAALKAIDPEAAAQAGIK